MMPSTTWLSSLRIYLTILVVADFVWEGAQMPFYSLWQSGSGSEIAFAVAHCTGGDMLIGGTSLVGSLMLFGLADWPKSRFLPIGISTIVFGLGYTIYSEHVNTANHVWTYSALMPPLPWLGTGLVPLAQWLFVPAAAFVTVRSGLNTGIKVSRRIEGSNLSVAGSLEPMVAPSLLSTLSRRVF